MTKKETLSCYRCSKVATVYVPSNERVLCDDHFEIFAEAYSNLKTSAIAIQDYMIESIKAELPVKEASDEVTGIESDHRVPATLITDHLAQLATGTEPATCKYCGKPMQLHAQWETTKQVVMGAASEGALSPDFLKHFDENGYCLDCRTNDGISRGYYLVDAGMTRAGMIAHLNGFDHSEVHDLDSLDTRVPAPDASGQEHYHGILGTPMASLTKAEAQSKNFPIYIDEEKNIQWNNDHRAKKPVIFPIGMSDWDGLTFPSYNWFHSFLDHYSWGLRDLLAPNSCLTCGGTGHHPELNEEEDVKAYFDEAKIKAEEAARKAERAQKKIKVKAHSGPGIKPHDHRTKKKKYAPRQTGMAGHSTGGSAMSIPVARGAGKALSQTGGFMRLPPVERWWYDTMNAFHDMTHTEYKTPSYMYRNPNPMYYSPGSRRTFTSKPWRN